MDADERAYWARMDAREAAADAAIAQYVADAEQRRRDEMAGVDPSAQPTDTGEEGACPDDPGYDVDQEY